MELFLPIASCIVLLCPAFGQESVTSSPEPTRQSIMSELSRKEDRLRSGYRKHLRQAEESYSQSLKSYRNEAAKQLKELQAKFAADDLDRAVKLRDLARSLTSKPTTSPGASQTANDRIKELLNDASKLEAQIRNFQSPIEKVSGNWSGQFENGFKLQLAVSNDGYCVISTRPTSNKSARVPIQVRDRRLLVMRDGHNMIQEHIELLRSGDRLVALGWTTTGRECDPANDLPNILRYYSVSANQLMNRNYGIDVH